MDDTYTMIQDLMDQAATEPAEEGVSCPDTLKCTHRCSDVCWRTRWCEPWSGFGDAWPDDPTPIRAGAVEVEVTAR